MGFNLTNPSSGGGAVTGTIRQFAGASIPTGYLGCDGAAISRVDFADLFAIVSTTYGVGDGSTTFNLPDLRDRVPVGKNSSGTFQNLGANGGAETHTLTEAQMPAHSHTITGGGNTSGPANGARHVDNSTGNITTNSKGSGTAHNNLQPYLVVNHIIKT